MKMLSFRYVEQKTFFCQNCEEKFLKKGKGIFKF